jgi:ABC-type transport system involved in cytochrome bd biosynthesis fused ATPase/permease subunit
MLQAADYQRMAPRIPMAVAVGMLTVALLGLAAIVPHLAAVLTAAAVVVVLCAARSLHLQRVAMRRRGGHHSELGSQLHRTCADADAARAQLDAIDAAVHDLAALRAAAKSMPANQRTEMEPALTERIDELRWLLARHTASGASTR